MMKTNLQKLLKIRGVKLAIEISLLLLIFMVLKGWMQRDMIDGAPPALQGRLLNGQSVNLQSLKGEPVLLHFWASWCGICKLEQDSIEAISKDYTVISIAMKSGNNDEILQYLKNNQLSFPVITDTQGEIAERYGVSAVPASFTLYSISGSLSKGR
jgi:thiol-disulfide isomerase/thioredoxin